ncbi:uncharacterized protein EI90DRAFT_1834992 [Cantharellus anzutake]|uniref:uncharacterized protein n=1 Tax=Cantharellus anzutake TaxID=1750568 RepID=UPI0019083FC6|nr:uncharacterized protein EI90DRAFT_1834992 [Cantharellus anzutake]KAF8327255.1 hypothetical protein EI90DRAFT_1834992 [Cantharellus anzutake]
MWELETLVLCAPKLSPINSPLRAPKLRRIKIDYRTFKLLRSVDWTILPLEHLSSFEIVGTSPWCWGLEDARLLDNFLIYAYFPSLKNLLVPNATFCYHPSSLVSFLERHVDLSRFSMGGYEEPDHSVARLRTDSLIQSPLMSNSSPLRTCVFPSLPARRLSFWGFSRH